MARPTRGEPQTVAAPPPPPRAIIPRPAYLMNSCMWAGLGVLGTAAAPTLAAAHPVAWAAVPVAAGATARELTRGKALYRRSVLRAQCMNALDPVLGKGLLSLTLAGFRGIFGHTPTEVRIRYSAGQPDGDIQWGKTLCEVLQTRTGMRLRVGYLDRKKCRITLVVDNSEPAEVNPVVERTTKLITNTIPSSTVDRIGFDDQGNPIRIEVHHDAAHKLAARGYQARITRTLSATLPGRWRASWDMETDQVTFSVRPAFPDSVWVAPFDLPDADPLKTYRKVQIPFGVDEDGNQVYWRPAVDPHFLVVGATGTGKTSTEHTILATVARYNWPIWVADAKAIEFLGWKNWPNVQLVATSVEEQVAVIHRAWQVMEERYRLIKTGLAREEDFEPLLVFVDEWADMRVGIKQWYSRTKTKGMPTNPPVFDEYDSIARKGRSARVHLLVSLQRPDVSVFGSGESRDNFRCRVTMGRLSQQGAMMMWGDPSVGVSVPAGKSGRGTSITADNRIVETQCFRSPDPRKVGDDQFQIDLLRQLQPATRVHPRLTIELPQPVSDLDAEDDDAPMIEPTYWDYVDAPWVGSTDTAEWYETAAEFTEEQARMARLLASPTAILGLKTDPSHRDPAPSHRGWDDDPVEALVEHDDYEDPFAGYGPKLEITPGNVEIGDLLLVDDEQDHWAIVDSEPDLDFGDRHVALPWRDDADDEGQLVVPDDEIVTIRRYIEE